MTHDPARPRRLEEEAWMTRALQLAVQAAADGDVPVGAVVVDVTGTIIGEGRNTRERDGDPTGHAEIIALRAAAEAKGEWRLDGCALVVTLEPCPMCAGAAVLARVPRVVLGAWDPKMGACGSVWDVVRDRRSTHRVEVVGGVRESECSQVLREFFARRRAVD
ncbi:MAG: tRNA adenosine(34) deaminase TadA [Janibacter sp.]